MAVYVDNPRHPLGRMLMCHMMADSDDELHKMAQLIGLKRAWFQSRRHLSHYDICLTKRRLAVRLGAIEVTSRDLIKRARAGGGDAAERGNRHGI